MFLLAIAFSLLLFSGNNDQPTIMSSFNKAFCKNYTRNYISLLWQAEGQTCLNVIFGYLEKVEPHGQARGTT